MEHDDRPSTKDELFFYRLAEKMDKRYLGKEEWSLRREELDKRVKRIEYVMYFIASAVGLAVLGAFLKLIII